MYDLPSEEVGDPGLPDEFHSLQAALLSETCRSPLYVSDRLFTACDLNLYYDWRNPRWYKRPDWFLVLDVPRFSRQQDLRWSYVIWQESVAPFLVVELLSPGTEAEDLGQTIRTADRPPRKWEVYEQLLQVPYYIVYDRYQNRFRAFCLQGARYQEQQLSESGLWFQELNLSLRLWQGKYQGVEGLWLRWCNLGNQWVPTAAEVVEQERQQAEQERQRAEQERQRAEQERQRAEQSEQKYQELLQRLQSQGINPEDL